jgi:iron complex outermembrane receptor protein
MLLVLAIALLAPQAPARDSIPADTLRRGRVPDLEVTVVRRPEGLDRVPMSVGVVSREAIRQGQPTLGLDESLTRIPGVFVANRWNFSLDQRLSIRGFGSRANFGTRGVKVLLDGVPQTLPDGQSQLTNVEYASLERIEVLRGAASALYGNASGGALLLETESPSAPAAGSVSLEAGSAGSVKWTARAAGRSGQASGSLALSRFTTDGFRQQSAADIRQLAGMLQWDLDPGTSATFRFLAGDTPEAQNPGALTAAEVAANPDSAAAANIVRGADKIVDQQQVSLRLRHQGDGLDWSVTGFALWRDLENPLATPPPGPPNPNAGTWNTIDRTAGGLRADATWAPTGPVRLTFGVDVQRMADQRRNVRSLDGAPTDSVLADQRETVLEAGPFLQAQWLPATAVTVDAGIRYDRVNFEVTDYHLSDGQDNSGGKDMSAVSGNLGVVLGVGRSLQLFAQGSSAFETPTTTELVATATAGVGFNDALEPQRALSAEVGLRGKAGEARWSASLFSIGVEDAIIQQREVNGRAFFANAGKTRNRGIELGATGAPFRWLTLDAAYTYAHYRFSEYRIRSGTAVDTLDGNALAGIPTHFLRAGLRASGPAGTWLHLDQLLSSSLYADDGNAIEVSDWGAGVTNLRLGWTGTLGRARVEPFLFVGNLFDRSYIGSVTINGFGGRVFEPAPRRFVFAGASVGWASGR